MNSSENQVKRLTVDDIEVPEGMLDAYVQAGLRAGFQITLGQMDRRRKCFAAALLWLAENPIVPSAEESHEMREFWISFALNSNGDYPNDYPEVLTAEWQRRMFLRKPAALPDEVKSLLHRKPANAINCQVHYDADDFNSRIIAAWKFGKEGK